VTGDVGDVLAGRFNREPEKWEDRHARWTVWVRADLRDDLQARAQASGQSMRAMLDEVLVAGLTALDGPPTAVPDPPRKARRSR